MTAASRRIYVISYDIHQARSIRVHAYHVWWVGQDDYPRPYIRRLAPLLESASEFAPRKGHWPS
jgi:hypothetical protein